MLPLAVTVLEKLQTVPPSFWLKVALAIIGFVVAVLLLRKLAQVNKVVLSVVVVVVVALVGFNWIYERNEPAFLTPVVEKVAPFFPSKGSYGDKQKSTPRP